MACLCLSTPLIEHLCAHVDSTAVVFNISVDDNSVDRLLAYMHSPDASLYSFRKSTIYRIILTPSNVLGVWR